MDLKNYTTAQKVKICKDAIEAKKNGISITTFSKNINVSNSSIYRWMDQFKDSIFNDDGEIPKNLITAMVQEFNDIGSVRVEMIDVLVFSESVENNIFVSVEKPDIEDLELFTQELTQRILNKLQWCFSIKGFRFD